MLIKSAANAAHRGPARRRRGFSLVELMVGVTLGLFIVGGALTLFARNVISSRLLVAETRLNQDLRAAVDLVTRDLRRDRYWGASIQGTIAVGSSAVTTANPYSGADIEGGALKYRYSTDELVAGGIENNALGADEQFGVKLEGGALRLQMASGSWTDITDPATLTVTAFTIVPTATPVGLGQYCAKPCGAGVPNCPSMTVRSYAITVTGRSTRDANLQRTLRTTVRSRNDLLSGICPP